MGLKISGLNELRERLERLRSEEVMAKALAEQAQRMAAKVRDGLSEPPGGAGHDEPWLRTGALRNSVGAQADGLQAAVGSSDAAAVPQELGTAQMPARPFLAPIAAEMGEEVARAVGAAMAAALRGDGPGGDSTETNGTGAALSGGGFDVSDPSNRSGVGLSGNSTPNGGLNTTNSTASKDESSQQTGSTFSDPNVLLVSAFRSIAYNPGDYAPEGTLAGPFGERVVDLKNVPDNAKSILKYRVFFYDKATGVYQVGFSFPANGFVVSKTEVERGARIGEENGMVVTPNDSPLQMSNRRPISAVRIGFSGGGNSQPYFKVYNSVGQEISPITGRTITSQKVAHYPIDLSRTAGQIP